MMERIRVRVMPAVLSLLVMVFSVCSSATGVSASSNTGKTRHEVYFTINWGLPVYAYVDITKQQAHLSVGKFKSITTTGESVKLPGYTDFFKNMSLSDSLKLSESLKLFDSLDISVGTIMVSYFPNISFFSIMCKGNMYLIRYVEEGDVFYNEAVSKMKRVNCYRKDIYYRILPIVTKEDMEDPHVELKHYALDSKSRGYEISTITSYNQKYIPDDFTELVFSIRYVTR